MALKRPPQHRVDARPVYIHPEDDAWDHDRIKRECDALEAESDGASQQHPVALYISGTTRGDLKAPASYKGTACTAADYVKLGDAWQFHFARLRSADFARVQGLMGDSTQSAMALELCARLAFQHAEGPEIYGTIDEMHANDPNLVYQMAEFAYMAAYPLRDDEKKPKAAGVGNPAA